MADWLFPIIVGWAGGTLTAGLGAMLNDRLARRRESTARQHAALRERYDKGQKAIRLWVDATEDLNVFMSRVEANDTDEEFWALEEVFGRAFAGEAIRFIERDEVFKAREACWDAMLARQTELATQLGLPPVVDLHDEQKRLLGEAIREQRERRELREAKKKNPAPAPTDAGQDTGDTTSDDEEDDSRR